MGLGGRHLIDRAALAWTYGCLSIVFGVGTLGFRGMRFSILLLWIFVAALLDVDVAEFLLQACAHVDAVLGVNHRDKTEDRQNNGL